MGAQNAAIKILRLVLICFISKDILGTNELIVVLLIF